MSSFAPAIVLSVLFASGPVWAQSIQAQERPTALSSIFGIDLHNFLSNVPECAPVDTLQTEPCRVATPEADRFEVRGLPYLPISPGYKVYVKLRHGDVIQWVLTGNASNLHLVKEMLTDEYGKPVTSNHWIKLKSGASYESEAFSWSIQGTSINFGREINDLGRYSVVFSTKTVDTISKRSNTKIATTPEKL